MSILIKGLDMPKNGESIIMVIESNGTVIPTLVKSKELETIHLDFTQGVEIPEGVKIND